MKIGISALALNVAVFGVIAPSAFAQDRGNQFSRDRYTSVTERPQPEYDPLPINLGGFELWSNIEAAARYNDNIFATDGNEIADTYINLRPTAEVRSKWAVHALSAGVTVDHKEYLNEDSETVTDYNAFLQGRLDATRALNFSGQVIGGRYSESRYAPSSPGNAAEPTRYDRVAVDGAVNFNADRILLEGRVGQVQDDYSRVPAVQSTVVGAAFIPDLNQDFRDVTETFFSGRASYAVSPSIAVFAQGRNGKFEYDHPDLTVATRDATRTSYQVGANFEFAAPFRGDVAVGNVKQDNDDPTRPDTDGLSLNGRLLWFPTDITTVTFTGSRDVFDPGLRESSSAFNTNYGVRVDHELRRNILLFGSVGTGQRDYDIIQTTTPTYAPAYTARKDDFFDASIGVGYKLNRRLRLEAAYTLHTQDEKFDEVPPPVTTPPTAANDFDRKFDQNIISIGLKFYP